MNRITLTLSASLVALASVASAQGTSFTDIDIDGSGTLTEAEFVEVFGEAGVSAFASYDSDDDGFVTADEVKNAGTPETGEAITFEDLDVNQDGVLDESELANVFGGNANVALVKFDQNGDGYVTKDEVRSSDDPMGERGNAKWGEAGPGNSGKGSDDTETASSKGNSGGNKGGGNGNSGGGNSGGNSGGGNGNGGGNSGGKGNGRNG